MWSVNDVLFSRQRPYRNPPRTRRGGFPALRNKVSMKIFFAVNFERSLAPTKGRARLINPI